MPKRPSQSQRKAAVKSKPLRSVYRHCQAVLTDGKRANRTVSREIARIYLVRALDGQPSNDKLDAMITQARRHAYSPRPGRSFSRASKLLFRRTKKNMG